MKNIFLFLTLLILPLISPRAGDEDEVLRAERDLALCYQNSDAACIEQGVMENYTLTNSKGKITTRADDLAEARKHDPKYEICWTTPHHLRHRKRSGSKINCPGLQSTSRFLRFRREDSRKP